VGPYQVASDTPDSETPLKFHLRVGERKVPRLGLPIARNTGEISVTCYGSDGSEQGSEDSEAVHHKKKGGAFGELRRTKNS